VQPVDAMHGRQFLECPRAAAHLLPCFSGGQIIGQIVKRWHHSIVALKRDRVIMAANDAYTTAHTFRLVHSIPPSYLRRISFATYAPQQASTLHPDC